MMGTITQYRPAYFSGFETNIRTFSSLRELLSIDWVDNFRKLPNGQIDPNFHQYSISKYSTYKGYEYKLMAESDEGFSWWVIGYIDNIKDIKELPTFKTKHRD